MTLADRFAAVIAAWNAGDIDGALAGMADDVVWHVAVGAFPALTGKAAVRGFLDQLRADMAETRWRITRTAEAGDVLFAEGVDAYTRRDGTTVAMPYAAVVAFSGRLIVEWRDYIDTRRMERLRGGEAAPGWLAGLVR